MTPLVPDREIAFTTTFNRQIKISKMNETTVEKPAIPDDQQPLLPVAAVYVPATYSGDYRPVSCVGWIFMILLFHLLNVLLGLTAWSIITTGVSLSIALLPLCCLGIVIFRVVLACVRLFAQLDVELYNFISPPEEHVFLNIPEREAVSELGGGSRLTSGFSFLSPTLLLAALYFVTVKFGISTLSLMVLVFPVAGIVGLTTDRHDVRDTSGSIAFHTQFQSSALNQLALVSACAGVLIISLVLMHLVAWLSRTATRFFCCERFRTYQYVLTPDSDAP